MSGSETFGEVTLALCAIAARALGWRPAEFWAATPAELAACLADPDPPAAPLVREDLDRLMESDANGRR